MLTYLQCTVWALRLLEEFDANRSIFKLSTKNQQIRTLVQWHVELKGKCQMFSTKALIPLVYTFGLET
jgi:hypothetical protein